MGVERVERVVEVAVVKGEGVGGGQRERVVLGVCLREQGRILSKMRVHEGNI